MKRTDQPDWAGLLAKDPTRAQQLTGEDIRAWRRGWRVSQRQLARLLGVSRSCVVRWESDQRPRIAVWALAGVERAVRHQRALERDAYWARARRKYGPTRRPPPPPGPSWWGDDRHRGDDLRLDRGDVHGREQLAPRGGGASARRRKRPPLGTGKSAEADAPGRV